jgi:hypothetical protein
MLILYIFVTCKSRISKCYRRIVEMMKALNNDNYIIVLGQDGDDDAKDDTEKIDKYVATSHILQLESCNDNYEGLPEKVFKTFKFIYNNPDFNKYTNFCKLDDDVIIRKPLLQTDIQDKHYCGVVLNSFNGDRKWHIGKCSPTSPHNNKPFKGSYVPWCLGGNGYIVSRAALAVVNAGIFDKEEIYEDLYIAKLLRAKGIYPQHIPNLKLFLYSKQHSFMSI